MTGTKERRRERKKKKTKKKKKRKKEGKNGRKKEREREGKKRYVEAIVPFLPVSLVRTIPWTYKIFNSLTPHFGFPERKNVLSTSRIGLTGPFYSK